VDTKLGRLRELFADNGIDGLIITGPDNRYYMSGFSGSAATLVISADSAALITDFRYVEQAKAQAPEYHEVGYQRRPIGAYDQGRGRPGKTAHEVAVLGPRDDQSIDAAIGEERT